MKIWTDKQGKKLTRKEFLARWKEGIAKITPLQLTQNQINGFFIILIGELFGIYFTASLGQWWMFTILIGGYMVTKAQMTGTYQKKLLLNKMEETFNQNYKEVKNE